MRYINMDKAGKDYWDNSWKDNEIPELINLSDDSLNNYVNLHFDKMFHDIFGNSDNLKEKKILEIGCAKSVWLPYFHKRFGYKIYGLDYSENGCQLTEKMFSKYNIVGNIHCCDMFEPPEELIEAFDIVYSFGVLEHFEKTNETLSILKKFVKPGGEIITIIPNMNGITGFLQKILNKNVYDKHVPLNIENLNEAHATNDLEIKVSTYFLPINLSVVNIDNLKNFRIYKFMLHLHSILSKLVWIMNNIIPIRPNPLTSPYIVCYANKKSDQELLR